MPDSDLHPDIIRAIDVYGKAKPLVAALRAEIDRHIADNDVYIPATIIFAAGRLEKLFEEEGEDGD